MIQQAAFRITPDLRFLYPHPAHEAAFAELTAALRRGAALALVEGEVGTGKSILLRRIELALRTSGLRPRYIPYPELSVAALLAWAEGDPAFRQSGRPPVSGILLLDDADNCSDELLGGLREVAAKRRERHFGPQIVLVGGPMLWPRLVRALPQLAELVDSRVTISPFSADEISSYVRHRLQVAGRPEDLFSADAIAAIASYSRGVPRLVNQVCSRALILADLDRAVTISPATIAEAIDDCPAAALFARHGRSAAREAAPDATDAPSMPVPASAATDEPGSPDAATEPTTEPASTQAAADLEIPPVGGASAETGAETKPAPATPDIATDAVRHPPESGGDGAAAGTPAPAAPALRSAGRRKDGRLKFKALDEPGEAAASPAEVPDLPGPPKDRPAFSGFVPRHRKTPLQVSAIDGPASGGAPTAFSGFVARSKGRDTTSPLAEDKPAPAPGERPRRRYGIAAIGLLVAVTVGAVVVNRVSPQTTEAAIKAASGALSTGSGAVRGLFRKIDELIPR